MNVRVAENAGVLQYLERIKAGRAHFRMCGLRAIASTITGNQVVTPTSSSAFGITSDATFLTTAARSFWKRRLSYIRHRAHFSPSLSAQVTPSDCPQARQWP